MALKPTNKNWGENRTINYLGKDFGSFRQNLIDYAKTYFPNTYSDFNEASPGMMFIEMASYIGDVLSFYLDTQLKESILTFATERKNVMALAQTLGYKPKVTTPAAVNLTVYQLVPSIGVGANNRPDDRFYLKIKDGMQVISTSNSNVIFRTVDGLDFGNSSGREIDVYERDSNGEPTFYLITKTVKAISATETETTITIPNTTEYPTATLFDSNIIQIISVADSNGNKYYEVPYLAQESIFVENANTTKFSSEYAQYSGSVPYMLEIQKVPRRFSIKVNTDSTMEIQFGSGNTALSDDIILPNTKNIGLGLANSVYRLNDSIDPSNFLKTNTFGIAPAGQTLTVKYLTGGGIQSNVNQGDLITVSRIEYEEDLLSLSTIDAGIYQTVKNSLAVENLESATGGRGAESVEEIRQNALAMFGSQNRAVTRQDYSIRALSMPERYGSVAKVYVSADGEINANDPSTILSNPSSLSEFMNLIESLKDVPKEEMQRQVNEFISKKKGSTTELNNPFAVNLYVLGYDVNKKLTTLNSAVKQNLKTYLSEYRMLTDGVNIIDGFIVNIGVEFDIIVYSSYNKREVLANCLTELQDYFNIDNWTFNKPINISDIELTLANVDGVMSVPSVTIKNICSNDGLYSPNEYNIQAATMGKIVYPSLDPCVFEVKYPNKDIKGKVL
jgi:hypothetical protein